MRPTDIQNYLQPIGILILFFIILYGAYLVSRYAGKLQSGRTAGRNMTIIEAISVGPQKTLQIVRVGKTYMVVGVSRDHITYMREVTEEELNLESLEKPLPFSSILNKVIRKNKDQLHTGEDTDESFEKHKN